MATIVAVDWHGNDTVEVVYRTDDGLVSSRLLTRADQERLSVENERRLWTLDADGELFKLAAEARRIRLAHLFDPYVAVETSTIENIVQHLEKGEGASVKITVEIEGHAESFDDSVRRTVSENANQLGFEGHEFEA